MVPKTHQFHRLNLNKIIETIDAVVARMQVDVAGTSLSEVGHELAEIAQTTKVRVERIARPNVFIRCAIWSLFAVIIVLLGYKLLHLRRSRLDSIGEVIPVLEAGINIIVALGAGMFFLSTIESRMRRHRVLTALSELRSIVHVIDMHQLQKDPDELITSTKRDGTEAEERQRQDARHHYVSQYLDYCGELIALTGKLAGLYMEEFEDPVVIATVSDLDSLIIGLAHKIWLKISIIHTTMLLAQPPSVN